MLSVGTALSAFFDVQKGERKRTLLLFLWLFLFISCYYVLRPIRRGMVLDGLGNEYMPLIYIGTALVTGLVVWIYSRFAHLPRKKLISSIYGIFILNLIGWWGAFQFESRISSGLFWVWLDVFSIMGVTVFWMYANDLFDGASAKRLFGILSAGGGLGAVLGSSLTAALVEKLGSTNMLLVAAGMVAATLGIFLVMESQTKDVKNKRVASAEFDERDLSQLSAVLGLIFKNKFLLFLTLAVCFERIAPDLVQFLYHEVLNKLAHGRDAIAALDANLERWRGIGEFFVEMFLVSAVIQRLGTGFALSCSGGTIAVCAAAFAIFHNPLIVLALFHADETMRHSWFKAGKELTYTVTSREVLYKLKPVIEMFFYRFSRGIAGVAIFVVNTALGLGSAGVVGLAIFAGIVWAFCGLRLNAEFKRLEAIAALTAQGKETQERERAARRL